MDDVGLDGMRLQPARQPEPVPPGLIGADNPSDHTPGLASFSRGAASASSFFSGWRSTPGITAATSHFDWLISITATNVLSCSKAVRDLLASNGCDMGLSIA